MRAGPTMSPLSHRLLSLPKPGAALAARPPRAPLTLPYPDAASAKSPGADLVLRRRKEAAMLSAAVLSRFLFLPASAAAEAAADGGECPLEVAPSGLAFCDRVVGTGTAAQQGQLIKAHYTGSLEDGTVSC